MDNFSISEKLKEQLLNNVKLKEQLLKIVDNPETSAKELRLLKDVEDFDIREAANSHPNYQKAI